MFRLGSGVPFTHAYGSAIVPLAALLSTVKATWCGYLLSAETFSPAVETFSDFCRGWCLSVVEGIAL